MRLADKLREQVADDFEETKSVITKFLEDSFRKSNSSVGLYFEGDYEIPALTITTKNRSELHNIRENDYERVHKWLIDEGFKVRNAPVIPSILARLEISLY